MQEFDSRPKTLVPRHLFNCRFVRSCNTLECRIVERENVVREFVEFRVTVLPVNRVHRG